MFSFNKLITPQILSGLYIVTLILLAISAIISLVNGIYSAAIGSVISAIFARVFFECIMVTFKNNEYLRRIAESVETKTSNINQPPL